MTALFVGLDTAIAMLKRYRVLLVVLPLVMALGVQSCRLNSANGKLDKARATIAEMKAASVVARQAQIALNQAAEAAYKAQAERTDREYTLALSDARSRSNAYADRNRVRAYCEGVAGKASSAAKGTVAESRDRPSEDAVVVSRADFDTLNENTLRLKAAHEWGERLVQEGLAEKP